eukprot:COSAG02_NODE_2230_length_9425_cov_5.740039_3_plen_92_part_00
MVLRFSAAPPVNDSSARSCWKRAVLGEKAKGGEGALCRLLIPSTAEEAGSGREGRGPPAGGRRGLIGREGESVGVNVGQRVDAVDVHYVVQ